jgi:ADP-ribose pyrophosphatase YjhB (NUDIX family)
MARKIERMAIAGRTDPTTAHLTEGHFTTPAVQRATEIAARAQDTGEYLGKGNFGAAFRVPVAGAAGGALLVKLPATMDIHGQIWNREAQRSWFLHEAGVANELSAVTRVVPETVYVEVYGRPALVREYGEIATNDLTVAEYDRLAADLADVARMHWQVDDSLLVARRADGSLFIADVGMWFPIDLDRFTGWSRAREARQVWDSLWFELHRLAVDQSWARPQDRQMPSQDAVPSLAEIAWTRAEVRKAAEELQAPLPDPISEDADAWERELQADRLNHWKKRLRQVLARRRLLDETQVRTSTHTAMERLPVKKETTQPTTQVAGVLITGKPSAQLKQTVRGWAPRVREELRRRGRHRYSCDANAAVWADLLTQAGFNARHVMDGVATLPKDIYVEDADEWRNTVGHDWAVVYEAQGPVIVDGAWRQFNGEIPAYSGGQERHLTSTRAAPLPKKPTKKKPRPSLVERMPTYQDQGFTETGRWGRQGAGMLFTTGERILLLRRSRHVEEPGTWGIAGGAVRVDEYGGEEALIDAATNEVLEEQGSMPEDAQPVGSTVYRESGFQYTTFIMRVPQAEHQPRLNWESDRYGWFTEQELARIPLHFGVEYTLREARNLVFSPGKAPDAGVAPAPLTTVRAPELLYHGTSLAALAGILKKGLQPRAESGISSRHRTITTQAVFATDSLEGAWLYADTDRADAVVLEIDTRGLAFEPDYDDAGVVLSVDLEELGQALTYDGWGEADRPALVLGADLGSTDDDADFIQAVERAIESLNDADRPTPVNLSVAYEANAQGEERAFLQADPLVLMPIQAEVLRLPDLADDHNLTWDEGQPHLLIRQYLCRCKVRPEQVIGVLLWSEAAAQAGEPAGEVVDYDALTREVDPSEDYPDDVDFMSYPLRRLTLKEAAALSARRSRS